MQYCHEIWTPYFMKKWNRRRLKNCKTNLTTKVRHSKRSREQTKRDYMWYHYYQYYCKFKILSVVVKHCLIQQPLSTYEFQIHRHVNLEFIYKLMYLLFIQSIPYCIMNTFILAVKSFHIFYPLLHLGITLSHIMYVEQFCFLNDKNLNLNPSWKNQIWMKLPVLNNYSACWFTHLPLCLKIHSLEEL